MLIVKVKDPKQIDAALKVLKNKVNKTGLIREVRERMEYKKPSVVKREKMSKAIYKNKMRIKDDN